MQTATHIVVALTSLGDLMVWLPQMLAGPLDDAANFAFYREVNNHMRGEIDEFASNLLGRMMTWVGGIASTIFTLWIMIQGYRITTGQSRESMVAMATQSLRSVLIIGAATGLAFGGTTLHEFFTDKLNAEITQVVTGKDGDIYESIDRSLGYMQLAFSSIDAIQTGGDPVIQSAKTRNINLVALGAGGPAVVAGGLLLMNKIAMGLVLGFGPLFVMLLLFDRTKALFDKWVLYGIGTMFSLAVLSVMAAISMDVVSAVAATFWVGNWTGANPEGVTSLATQQGGLGIILTMMLLATPGIAASFFQGTLGQFSAYSAFGNHRGVDSAGKSPGTPGYRPVPAATNTERNEAGEIRQTGPRVPGNQSSQSLPGQRGLANRDSKDN